MAKSLRSKWKRKMKAIKRVRYGEKELKRLKDMVNKTNQSNSETIVAQIISNVKDIEMKNKDNGKETEKMETNNDLKRDPKTFRDQFGHYPQWMSGRQVKKIKTKIKRLKHKK